MLGQRSHHSSYGTHARTNPYFGRKVYTHGYVALFGSGLEEDVLPLLCPTTSQPVPAFACAFSRFAMDGDCLAVADERGYVHLLNTGYGQDLYSSTVGLNNIDRTTNVRSKLIEPCYTMSLRHTSYGPRWRDQHSHHTQHVRWPAHSNAIFDIAWLGINDTNLLTASGDQTIALWQAETQQLIARFGTGHTSSVKCVATQPGNPYVFLSGGRDGKIMLWDTRLATKCNDGDMWGDGLGVEMHAHVVLPFEEELLRQPVNTHSPYLASTTMTKSNPNVSGNDTFPIRIGKRGTMAFTATPLTNVNNTMTGRGRRSHGNRITRTISRGRAKRIRLIPPESMKQSITAITFLPTASAQLITPPHHEFCRNHTKRNPNHVDRQCRDGIGGFAGESTMFVTTGMPDGMLRYWDIRMLPSPKKPLHATNKSNSRNSMASTTTPRCLYMAPHGRRIHAATSTGCIGTTTSVSPTAATANGTTAVGLERGKHGYTSLALDPNGKYIYASSTDHHIYVYAIHNPTSPPIATLTNTAMSCVVPPVQTNARSETPPRFAARTFYVKMDVNVVGDTVLTGSSDGHAYLFPSYGHPVPERTFSKAHASNVASYVALPGHRGEVTCVAWHQRHPYTFVTAADDSMLRIWHHRPYLTSHETQKFDDVEDWVNSNDSEEAGVKVDKEARRVRQGGRYIDVGVESQGDDAQQRMLFGRVWPPLFPTPPMLPTIMVQQSPRSVTPTRSILTEHLDEPDEPSYQQRNVSPLSRTATPLRQAVLSQFFRPSTPQQTLPATTSVASTDTPSDYSQDIVPEHPAPHVARRPPPRVLQLLHDAARDGATEKRTHGQTQRQQHAPYAQRVPTPVPSMLPQSISTSSIASSICGNVVVVPRTPPPPLGPSVRPLATTSAAASPIPTKTRDTSPTSSEIKEGPMDRYLKRWRMKAIHQPPSSPSQPRPSHDHG